MAINPPAVRVASRSPAPRPRPMPQPKLPTQSAELMSDAAMDRYPENVAKRSSKTSSGYRYPLQQFYASRGNPLSHVTTQHPYDFVAYLRHEGLADFGARKSLRSFYCWRPYGASCSATLALSPTTTLVM